MHEPVVPEVVMNRETGESRKEAQLTLSLSDCLKERTVTQIEEGKSPSWNEGCVLDRPPKKRCQVNAKRIKFSAHNGPLSRIHEVEICRTLASRQDNKSGLRDFTSEVMGGVTTKCHQFFVRKFGCLETDKDGLALLRRVGKFVLGHSDNPVSSIGGRAVVHYCYFVYQVDDMLARRLGDSSERDRKWFARELVDFVIPEGNVDTKDSSGGLCLSGDLLEQVQVSLKKRLTARTGESLQQVGLDVVMNPRKPLLKRGFLIVADDVFN